tara:strand:- start:1115 stop:1516 length:402 start_codon:yes stop_codon:yes gene_type:complete
MANLHKFTVQEALNSSQGTAGSFNIADNSSGGLGGTSGDAIQAGSSANPNNTKHFDIAAGTHQLIIYPEGDIYWNFATSDEDIVVNTNLKLPGDVLTSLAVPKGLISNQDTDTIRFNFNSTSTTQHIVRIVEV